MNGCAGCALRPDYPWRMTQPLRPLTAVEARILGTLMEKARTVPDSYPLTLNNLVLGCNQKTTRDPVMQISETDAQDALDALRPLGLVLENSGGRSTRYEHNFQRGVGVPEQSAVILGLMLLRGPQTAGELRLNTERWYRFADISSVEAFLEELQDRPQEKGGPLVVKLARTPGAREQRWAHLLCGPVDMQTFAASAGAQSVLGTTAPLAARLAALEAEVVGLRVTIQMLCKELGLPAPQSEPNTDLSGD